MHTPAMYTYPSSAMSKIPSLPFYFQSPPSPHRCDGFAMCPYLEETMCIKLNYFNSEGANLNLIITSL